MPSVEDRITSLEVLQKRDREDFLQHRVDLRQELRDNCAKAAAERAEIRTELKLLLSDNVVNISTLMDRALKDHVAACNKRNNKANHATGLNFTKNEWAGIITGLVTTVGTLAGVVAVIISKLFGG